MTGSKKKVAGQAKVISQWVDAVLESAHQVQVKAKVVEKLSLPKAGREVLATLDGLSARLKKKLADPAAAYKVGEALTLVGAIVTANAASSPKQERSLLRLTETILDAVKQEFVAQPHSATTSRKKKPRPTKTLYQFKITLLHSKPPIWRRIQVMDCTLDQFHEHIQTAMGWTNSHLHQFEIEGQTYGHPDLLGEDGDLDFEDSTRTILSQILPSDGKRFRFRYEYDFGDGWLHEVLLEGCPKPATGQKYPVCVEGSLACPPEDVGGMGGYYNYLDAISDPKHAQHKMYLDWAGPFNPDEFDPAEATEMMQAGLPAWGD